MSISAIDGTCLRLSLSICGLWVLAGIGKLRGLTPVCGVAPAPGMVIQYQAGRMHRALCLEPVRSEGIPGTPSGRSSIVQTSPAKYNPFPRSALSLNTKFVNNFFYSQK